VTYHTSRHDLLGRRNSTTVQGGMRGGELEEGIGNVVKRWF